MRIGLIGIGQAGGKITDRLLEYDLDENEGGHFIQGCVAINTARQDLSGLQMVPEENRLLVGESRVKGNGVGADNTKGRDIMEEEVGEVLQYVNEMPIHNIDAFVVVAALGGGTGSGGLPVLARELNRRFSEPVFGLGVLPAEDEGSIYSINAARSLEACVEETDNLMIFDNELWSKGKSLEDSYRELNDKLASRFGTLFSAGEVEESTDSAQSVVDASEVINTLDCGGITSIGYAEAQLDEDKVNPGLIKRFMGGSDVDENKATTRMRTLAEKSISGKLTLQANIESTERALILYSGPSKFLTRKGTEEGRSIIERRCDCMEVRGGDYPIDNPSVTSTVVLSGLYDVPRVKELQRMAVEADKEIKEMREERENNMEKLLQEEAAEEIDSLLDL
jgi:cell division GTPase FtsZ